MPQRPVTHGLEQLEAPVHQRPLVAALASVRATAGLVDASTRQVIDLSAVWFPALGDTPQSSGALLARFGADSAHYASEVSRFRELGVVSVVAGLAHIEADPPVLTFEHAVTAALSGTQRTGAGGSAVLFIDLNDFKAVNDSHGHEAVTPGTPLLPTCSSYPSTP